ncbi:AAA family ATPase [Microcoleus sp. FACHB-831]|uniref:AAA family ATPase n=1 Tax=Microcoleus sp. FACHB-831 TaxID=2692827 RepID=UPI001689C565|nr:AAA family ATPase [Microcoleus sp. FACHB-831]MBD1924008.1 AAA family ATPase [Microcoleus sp. FACHB-831]
MYKKSKTQELLGAGWQPLYREVDWGYLWQLASNEPLEITHKTVDLASYIADALGRNDYAWWANILNVFYENTRDRVDEYWNYITPAPPAPDDRYDENLSTETPLNQSVSRDTIPIEHVLKRLQEIAVLKVVELLGRPDLITQAYEERHFYYPVHKFVDWNRIEIAGTVLAYWSKHDIWLHIVNCGKRQRRYTLTAKELGQLVNKATYNLAVMLSGYQSRVGKVNSQYPIRTFPADIQSFTDNVQQEIINSNKLAVLVYGKPGTGKTVWTQAVAKEILAPLGYVIFILDHDAVENFVPPTYLEKICIIINEADNLAKDRASEAAQNNSKTEHILSLLDGTLYQSVIDEAGIQAEQKLVVLMTCNTTERLDPAMLRKGRVDFTYEFIHRFV